MLISNGRLTAKGKAQVGSFANERGLDMQMLFDEIAEHCYTDDSQVVKYCEEFMFVTSLLREHLRRGA